MLRKFAASLLATTLIAGAAVAAPASNSTGPSPAAAAAPASTAAAKQTAKPAGTVKHARKHIVRHKVGATKVSRHAKSTNTHRHQLASPVKPAKGGKGGGTGA